MVAHWVGALAREAGNDDRLCCQRPGFTEGRGAPWKGRCDVRILPSSARFCPPVHAPLAGCASLPPVKSVRIWVLILLAALLPLRGAMAAAMLCPPAVELSLIHI